MTKILYITNGMSGSGGLERVLSVKASQLADNYDNEVHILTLNEQDKKSFYCLSPKIVLHTITVTGNIIKYVYQYLHGLKRIIREVQPDVISVCDDGFKGFLVPYIIRKRYPIIYERHATVLINFKIRNSGFIRRLMNKVIYRAMKLCARQFDYFIVLTKSSLYHVI
jgi:hypothetical protein